MLKQGRQVHLIAMIRQRLQLIGVALVFLSVSQVVAAKDQKRFALLIGNQAYSDTVGPLKNPHNDIRLLADALAQVGFEVNDEFILKDATYHQIDKAIRRYARQVRRAGNNSISFVYYSGHGAVNSEDGLNYLIPVDALSAEDDDFWSDSYPQKTIIDTLQSSAPDAIHYLVFDACRNELKLKQSDKSMYSSAKGFKPVDFRSGLLIAHSTAPNKPASDKGQDGGPFAKALAEELVKPGLESVDVFRNVQRKLKQSIEQEPWLSLAPIPFVYLAGDKDSGLDAAIKELIGQCRSLVPPPRIHNISIDSRAIGICAEAIRKSPNNADANFAYGRLLDVSGQGKLAENAYLVAADQGHSLAMTNLGWLYDRGAGVEQSISAARRWYEKAIQLGEPIAMNNLGWLFDRGAGVDQDYTRAQELYERAEALGEPMAMNNIGFLHERGAGVQQNYTEAQKWYAKSARHQYPLAMTNLGSLYERGSGVKQSYFEAMRWYTKAADLGEPIAMTNLGWLHDRGAGIPQNFEEARRWYQKAADLGHKTAMNNIGWLYERGAGVERDYTEARRWYQEAADLGEPLAMTNLGWLYERGAGVERDGEEARRWYTKAAELGEPVAIEKLSRTRGIR